jgi:uncharacterized secreted protein with C-terminal beta-propeller domain
MARRRTLIAGGTVAALVAALGVAQLAPGAAPTAHAEGLVPYDSCSDLLNHYRDEIRASATPYGFGYGYGYGIAEDGMATAGGGIARAAAPMSQAAGAGDKAASSAGGMEAVGNGATGTNVQEQGVDEPDVAKLRDGRLVVVTQGRLQVVTAEAKPKLVGSLRVTDNDEQTYGSELLLVDDRALLVVPGWRQPAPAATRVFRPGTPTTKLVLLDLSTDQPRLIEEATYDAQYVSARLVDGTVRLVTSTRPQLQATYPQRPGEEPEALAANLRAAGRLGLDDVLPHVVRTAADGTPLEDGNAVSCDQTSHAQTPVGASTLLVTTLRPGSGLAATDNDAVTTDGDLVYASTNRLYVATSRWGTVAPAGPVQALEDKPTSDTPGATTTVDDEVRTEIHAFDTSGATTTRYLGTGTVPGWVLGRWAFSSYDDVLRVATTRQPPWNSSNTTTSSMVVKLAEQGGKLVETGRLEGLGKGERIQAVRYFGDIAAVVTFRQTDPLFLIDLSGQPRLLGELKVPGFSTYLHPIGGGKLLGLGQEADTSGRIQGAQISVYDVNDLAHPVQVDRLQLGQGWTPAMQESRAFTYDPKRRMALFAYQVWDSLDGRMPAVGAVGIHVSADGHLDEVGRMPVHPTTPTNRVLIDDAHLYAVSDSGVAAGDPATMLRTGAVDFAR